MDNSHDEKPSTLSLKSGWAALQTKAEAGDAEAQFSLGLRYGSAVGTALDFVQAARWYTLAADQDHALAQFNLGVMFAQGQGVPQSDAKAAIWTRKAAEGGDAGGQYNLGMRCHRASVDPLRHGAFESRIEAYKWLLLASVQGYADSLTARQRLTLTMTAAEVEEGNQRAASFVPRTKRSAMPDPRKQ
jgi:TPR repeat protein